MVRVIGTRSLALLLPLLAACASAPPVAPRAVAPVASPIEEWDRELPPGTQHHAVADEEEGESAFVPVRVVDDVTGEPIAGARIDNWWEADTPNAEPWKELLAGTWTTDQDGWVLLPVPGRAQWYFVEAPGYAPFAEMAFQEEFRLVRGRDFMLEVRDWRDRPVPGAVVEALLGCGHTPTVRTATAGPDGRLTFRCIDPSSNTDLWVRTPGLTGRNPAYWGGGPEGLPVEAGVPILRCDPSPVLEGRVLRADGTPAAGARVGTRQAHRGPWTVADSDGRYRLVGALPHDGLIAMAPIADPPAITDNVTEIPFEALPGLVTTVRLQVEAKPNTELEKYLGTAVRVHVLPPADSGPVGTMRVVLVRDGDGKVLEKHGDFQTRYELFIPVEPGAWTVTAGEPAGRFRPVSRKVEVREGWADVTLPLEPNPVWKPEIVERRPDGTEAPYADWRRGELEVTTDDGVVPAALSDRGGLSDGPAFHIPASGPFAVEYRAPDGASARLVFDGPPAEGISLVLPASESKLPWGEGEKRPRVLPPAGTGEVAVRAVEDSGVPIEEFAVALGGWKVVEAEGGVVRLPGVGAGPLRVWVAAPGRRMHDLRLVLAAGEKREVTVRMRP
jgi:hypothetical protein